MRNFFRTTGDSEQGYSASNFIFLNTGGPLPDCNETNIVLVPKKRHHRYLLNIDLSVCVILSIRLFLKLSLTE